MTCVAMPVTSERNSGRTFERPFALRPAFEAHLAEVDPGGKLHAVCKNDHRPLLTGQLLSVHTLSWNSSLSLKRRQ